jgi:hypothetical protein
MFSANSPNYPLRSFRIAPLLNQDIQHLAFLIHRWPQVNLIAFDLQKHVIEAPGITTTPLAPAKVARVPGTELQHPGRIASCLSRQIPTSFLARRENSGKSEVQPRAMGDDLGGEAATTVRGVGVYCAIALPGRLFDKCRSNQCDVGRSQFAAKEIPQDRPQSSRLWCRSARAAEIPIHDPFESCFSPFTTKGVSRSMGSGKMMVVFLSAPMTVSVSK